MAKSTKWGYKKGRLKRDNEENSDNEASWSCDKDYNDMLGDDYEDKEDDEDDHNRDKYPNNKKGKEHVRVIGKSKDNVSVAEIERHWVERLD